MAEHHLKTVDPYYHAIADGTKTFEVRKDDRGFKVGDILHLHYFDPALCDGRCPADDPLARARCVAYLGSSRTFEITYVYGGEIGGIEPGYVVLGLGEVDESC